MGSSAVGTPTTTAMGKLIALEGDHDTVSTQLQLLPPSQKILILPSILDNLEDESDSFNARHFVQKIHTVLTERTQKARLFLESSESAQPRLVFTNGGTVSARAACIARIAEKTTEGDLDRAETIFRDIVKSGVTGILKEDVPKVADVVEDMDTEDAKDNKGEHDDDPTSKAMKAAEALDREAATLDSNEPVDRSAEALHGDKIIPELDSNVDDIRDSSVTNAESANKEQRPMGQRKRQSRQSTLPKQEVIFTAAQGEEIRRTFIVVPHRNSSLWQRRNTLGTEMPQMSQYRPWSGRPGLVSDVSEDETEDDSELHSPGEDTFPSTPGVVFGEACLVDMQSAESEAPLRKSRSVDRFFPSLFQDPQQTMHPVMLRHSRSQYNIRKTPATTINKEEREFFPTLPRTTFVKASQTTIKKSPTMSDVTSSCASSVRTATRVFVDRGTDAEEVSSTQDTDVTVSSQITEHEHFEPVFPVVEDLVINLRSQNSNELIESIIASYKNRDYPEFPANLTSASHDTESTQKEVGDAKTSRPISNSLTSNTVDVSSSERRQSYDPFVYHPAVKTQLPYKDNLGRVDSAIQVEPPTPCVTPGPNGVTEKFVDFYTGNALNSVSLQNSIREILSEHCSTSEGYSQHKFSASSETERFWKPVFRTDENNSFNEEGRSVDQIIALGCEPGVKKDFFSQISGSVEKLGIKRSGISRSGKLDIRYLVSNITQSTPNASLPISNPQLLASLLVPQLEAYLASNTSTRLLILHYTTEHLATILALQHLVGTETLKVAGILDNLSSDPPSLRPRTPRAQQINPLSNEATMTRPASRRQPSLSLQQQLSGTGASPSSSPQKQAPSSSISFPTPSFAKANFLIPSTATDSEITTFLSGIWKSLMDRSPFYTPEPEPKPVIIMAPPMPAPPRPTTPKANATTQSSTTAASIHSSRVHERSTTSETSYPPSSFKAPKNSGSNDKISRLTGSSLPPANSNGSQRYAPSVASSVRTTASEKVRRDDREWENFYIAEEDSDDDEFDKMILGRGFAKITPEVKKVGGPTGPNGQKRGTKKALKWLGLA